MNRQTTFAMVLILTIPAASHGQHSLEDFMDAHSRTRGKPKVDPYEFIRWNAFNRAGWRALSKGYFDTAEHEFASAIEVAKKEASIDKDNRLLARSYADYALALQSQGRHAEAEPLVKWVLLAREAELEADSPAIVQTLNQLGTLYYELGQFKEAELYLKRAVDQQAKSARPNAFEYSRSETLLGLVLVTQRRYDEAESPFRQAITLREQSQGPSNVDTGDALSNLAWVYLQQGKFAEARPMLMRALKIFEQSRGSADPSVAHTYHGLAKIQASQGENEEAETKYLQAIAIWDSKPELDAAALVEVLRDYAAFLEKLGRAEDLVKIKARLTPLQAKYSANSNRAERWYRWPDTTKAPANDLGTRRNRT